jgi:subtilase family serine protease
MDAAPGFAACGAQVVTNAQGAPLASSGAPPAGAYGPAQFHTGYNLPSAASAAGTTIAIVDAYDDPNIASDLAAYDSQYGLPPLGSYPVASPWFRKVNQAGGTSYPNANSGWALEISLDVETAHEICQNCNILLVEASSNSFANLGAAENEAVALGSNVVSNSWGGNDSSSDSSYDGYFNHPGVVITASTGDSGYGVEYPAASRYVTAVGGTTLTLDGGSGYVGESAWVDGGSGCSRYETKPSWQIDSGCAGRTVADVSADADPNTGAAVYDTYGYSGWLQVGGTSLSSPLIAAVYALSGNTSDGAAPYGDPGALHDVTSGANGSCSPSYLCTAGSGYDGPTGLGTPNGVGAFTTSPPSPDFSLAVSPSSRTVTQGQGTSYTLALTPNGAFNSSDSVGVTAGFSPGGPTVTPSCTLTTASPSCTLTVSTSSTTATGNYTLNATGTDAADAITHSTSATLAVQALPTGDFSLSVSPSSRTLRTPGSTTYTITVSDLNGFTGAVNLSASGLPSGVTASFSPQLTTSTATLTVSATRRLARAFHTFQVTGIAGSLTHSITASLSLR